jgi:hypothetical protein
MDSEDSLNPCWFNSSDPTDPLNPPICPMVKRSIGHSARSTSSLYYRRGANNVSQLVLFYSSPGSLGLTCLNLHGEKVHS